MTAETQQDETNTGMSPDVLGLLHAIPGSLFEDSLRRGTQFVARSVYPPNLGAYRYYGENREVYGFASVVLQGGEQTEISRVVGVEESGWPKVTRSWVSSIGGIMISGVNKITEPHIAHVMSYVDKDQPLAAFVLQKKKDAPTPQFLSIVANRAVGEISYVLRNRKPRSGPNSRKPINPIDIEDEAVKMAGALLFSHGITLVRPKKK